MSNEVETIRLDGIEYRLPYADVLDQTVDDESLVTSIEKEGMIYPIVWRMTEEGREIIDGNTRARLIAEGKVELDEIPLENVDVVISEGDERTVEDKAYDLAIQLNFQRRQISPSHRRKTIVKVHDTKNWRGKPSSHVKELAELLGVSRATISTDISNIWGDEEVEEIRDERRRINHLLTGLRFLDGQISEIDLSDKFDEVGIEKGKRYMIALQEGLEARREEINRSLKGSRKEEAA